MNTLETPKLDEIAINDWFSDKYNPEQQVEIDDILNKKVWITAKRVKIPVREMSNKHIDNCVKCWNGKGNLRIPTGYLGGKQKWLKIFKEELIKRQ